MWSQKGSPKLKMVTSIQRKYHPLLVQTLSTKELMCLTTILLIEGFFTTYNDGW